MEAKQTLLTIIASTLLATTPIVAQQPTQPKVFGGKELKEFVLNYSGKDSLFFRNGVNQFQLFQDPDSKEYKVYKEEDDYQSHNKPTIVLDEKELKRAINYKNYVAKYSSLDEALLDITRETQIKLPSIVENKIKNYFETALQYFEKAPAGSGQVIIGEARKYIQDCRDIARKIQENTKEENKYGLEYAIKYMDTMLSDVTTALDLNPGIYKTNHNGKELIIVSMYTPQNNNAGQRIPVSRYIMKTLADSTNIFVPGSIPDISKITFFGIQILENQAYDNKNKIVAVVKAIENNKTTSVENEKDKKITNKLLPTLRECTINWDNYPNMQNYK